MQSTTVVILLLIAVAANAISVRPVADAVSPPKWPAAFNTKFDDVRIHPDQVLVGEWWWSEQHQAERLDYIETPSDAVVFEVKDYGKQQRWVIREEINGTVSCEVAKLDEKMPTFDFSKFTYKEVRVIRGIKCEIFEHDAGGVSFVYAVRADNGHPVELARRIHGRHEADVIYLYELVEKPQDASTFNITALDVHRVCKKLEGVESGRNVIVKPKLDLPRSVCNSAASIAHGKASCGCPYVWGGNECGCNGRGGLDCSGLTSYSYRTAGWGGIARTASAQARQGGSCGACRPNNPGACIPGDLFFFNFGGGGIEHVVMYIGGDRIAECPHAGENCHVVPPYMVSYVTCRRFC